MILVVFLPLRLPGSKGCESGYTQKWQDMVISVPVNN